MNDFAKEFVDTFNTAAQKASRAKIFDDFLKISAATLNRDEETFQSVENKELHLELFTLLAGAINYSIADKVLHDKKLGINYKPDRLNGEAKPHYRDVLGEIYSELDLFEQSSGQVFTPQSTAVLMAELSLPEEFVRREINLHGFISLQENCCGSGALILGGLNALLNMKINPCRYAFVKAADLDPRCVLMTFIQLSLYGIKAVVQRRDAVTDEALAEPLFTPVLRRSAA